MGKKSWIQFLDSPSDNRKSKTRPELCRRIQNRKWLGLVALAVAFALCGAAADAQQPKKVARICSLEGGCGFRSSSY